MTRILAIANIKGGVGKTTTTANLAAALAARGRRVLAIDLDPQSSLTASIAVTAQLNTLTIADALDGKSAPVESLIVSTTEGFDLVPACRELRSVERELEGRGVRPFGLRDAIAPLDGRYAYILIDCPANAGILTGCALATATDVVIPLPPDYLALQTVDWLVQITQQVRGQLNPNLRVAGLLLAMYAPGTAHARQIITTARARYGIDIPFFSTAIRLDDKLRSAPLARQSILRYAPDSASAAAYRHLAGEIEEGIREPEPVDAAGAMRRARLAGARGDRGAAYRDYCRATELEPQHVAAWIGRAESAEDETEAIRAWARAAQLDPACEQARLQLGSSITAHLIRSSPPAIQELVALGHYLLQAGQQPYAELAFRRVTDLAPEHAEAWLGRARAAQDSQAALAHCDKVISLAPNDARALAEREVIIGRLRAEGETLVQEARRAAQSGERAGAHRLFRRAAELDPHNERAWLGCARTCGDNEQAVGFVERALEVNPDSTEALTLFHWLWTPEPASWTSRVPWSTLISIALALAVLVSTGFLLFQHLFR